MEVREGHTPLVGRVLHKITESSLHQLPRLVAIRPSLLGADDDVTPSLQTENGLVLGNGRIPSLDGPVRAGNSFCCINCY
jgi:hypothetical protein